MKMGPATPGNTGKIATRKSQSKKAIGPEQTAPAVSLPVDTQQQLGELADLARRELIAKAGLQTSLKHKLLDSRNRADEIRRRIQNGYYSRPEVLRNIADRLADDMEP